MGAIPWTYPSSGNFSEIPCRTWNSKRWLRGKHMVAFRGVWETLRHSVDGRRCVRIWCGGYQDQFVCHLHNLVHKDPGLRRMGGMGHTWYCCISWASDSRSPRRRAWVSRNSCQTVVLQRSGMPLNVLCINYCYFMLLWGKTFLVTGKR